MESSGRTSGCGEPRAPGGRVWPGGTLGGGFRGFRGRVVGGVLCFGAVLWYWVAVFGDGMGDGVEGWAGIVEMV